jgi:hypothetical protein
MEKIFASAFWGGLVVAGLSWFAALLAMEFGVPGLPPHSGDAALVAVFFFVQVGAFFVQVGAVLNRSPFFSVERFAGRKSLRRPPISTPSP